MSGGRKIANEICIWWSDLHKSMAPKVPTLDMLHNRIEAALAEAALRAETPAPLLYKASTHKPSGCYCPPNDCQAPKIMGRQVPCSRPCETYTEMCKPGSSVKLRYYCVLPKNHTKPHAFHATAEQARVETPAPREELVRDKIEAVARLWYASEPDKGLRERLTEGLIDKMKAAVLPALAEAGEPEQAK